MIECGHERMLSVQSMSGNGLKRGRSSLSDAKSCDRCPSSPEILFTIPPFKKYCNPFSMDSVAC